MSSNPPPPHGLSRLQRIAFTLMAGLVFLTFVGTNLHTLLWQSSDWLVSTILPAAVVDLTNQERAANDAPLLRRSELLDQAATKKAQHMVAEGYFAHFSPDGVSPWHWFGEVGYRYAHAGENLAVHFTDSTAMVEAWMQSPTHRENIVNAQYTEIGIGTATGTFEGYRTVFVVQLFGTPAVPDAAPAAPAAVEDEPLTATTADQLAGAQPPTTTRSDTPPVPSQSAPPAALPAPSPVALGDVTEPTTATVTDPTAAERSSPAPVAPLEQSSDARATPPTPTPERIVRTDGDMVRIETSLIATSSGLAAAHLREPQEPAHAGATMTALLTQPNQLLERVYIVLATIVVLLLAYSIALETRRLHYRQVVYGCVLLVGMVGLWLLHATLTSSAVVV